MAGLLALAPAYSGAQSPGGSGTSGGQAAQGNIKWTKIGDLDTVPENTNVFLRARLLSTKSPDPGSRQPHSFYLSDETGTIRVVIWQNVWDQLENKESFQAGLTLDVYGEVSTFKGSRQVAVNNPKWLRVAPVAQTLPDSIFREQKTEGTDPYVEVSIGALNLSLVGKQVRLRGTVSAVEASPAPRVPTRVILKDNTGEAEVIFWTEVETKLTSETRPVVGMEWEAAGTLDEFRGKLQLKCMDHAQVKRPAPKTEGPTG